MSSMDLYRKLVAVAMIMAFVMFVLGSTCQPVEAARLLEEEGQKMKLIELLGFSLESLPRGSNPPSDHSGCTHGSASGGACSP